MSNRGQKHFNKKSASASASAKDSQNDQGSWRLIDDFNYDYFKKFVPDTSNYNMVRDIRVFSLLHGNTSWKVKSVASTFVSEFKLQFTNGENNDTFFNTLYKYDMTVTYTQKVALYDEIGGKKISRNGRRFNLVDSEPKVATFPFFAISVGDLVKGYYFKNKYQANEASNKMDEKLDDPNLDITFIRKKGWKAGNTENVSKSELKKMSDFKKQLIHAVMKTDYENNEANFMGLLSGGIVTKMIDQMPVCKTTTVEAFLASKLIIDPMSVCGVTHFYSYLKIDKKNAKIGQEVNRLFMNFINEKLIDSLVSFFYLGQSLYAIVDEKIVFDEPINIKEFIEMIDDNWKPSQKDFSKKRMLDDIFCQCNERQQEVLDAQKEMIFDNIDQIDDFCPVYAYRKFYFTQFSYKMVADLHLNLWSAKLTHIVPKRWRGNKKMQAIKQEWCMYRDNSHNYKKWEKIDAKFHKNNEHRDMGNEGRDEFYDLLDSKTVDDDDEDNQVDFVYDLPVRINPDNLAKDDRDLLEGELYRFMADDEVIAKAGAIERSSMTFGDKLREFNLIGYSRTSEDNDKVYLLLPAGHTIKESFTKLMRCEEFYVPKYEKRLPKIILMSLPDEEDQDDDENPF